MMRENGVQSFCSVPLTTGLPSPGRARVRQPAHASRIRKRTCASCSRSANQVAVAVDNVLHDEERAVGAAAADARARSAPAAARGEQRRRLAAGPGPRCSTSVSTCLRRVIPHETVQPAALRARDAPVSQARPDYAENDVVVKDCQSRSAMGPIVRPASPSRRSARPCSTKSDLQELMADSKMAECAIARGVSSRSAASRSCRAIARSGR